VASWQGDDTSSEESSDDDNDVDDDDGSVAGDAEEGTAEVAPLDPDPTPDPNAIYP
jgi:hypothetical protein